MAFKTGDKVVFVGNGKTALRESTFNRPPKHSIVILKSPSQEYPGSWNVEGYEYDLIGITQSFRPDNFRPLDYDFVEKVLSKIKEEPILTNENKRFK